jgi:hypothetical protein
MNDLNIVAVRVHTATWRDLLNTSSAVDSLDQINPLSLFSDYYFRIRLLFGLLHSSVRGQFAPYAPRFAPASRPIARSSFDNMTHTRWIRLRKRPLGRGQLPELHKLRRPKL